MSTDAMDRRAWAPRTRTAWAPMLGALLVATALRTYPLLDNRFHPDEALYGSFARRIASGHDPMLSAVVVDKPPLPFYLTALSLAAIGSTEFAARLPSLYASLATVALAYALARRLYAPPVPHLAAWLMALSPFAILFAITLFIDPLLSAAGMALLWAARLGRWRQAGLLLALAFAVKQTAVVFVPLALALGLLRLPASAGPREALRSVLAAGSSLVLGLGLAALAVFTWDTLRQPSIGFWLQGYADNMPGRLIRASEVLPRARAWLGWLHYITASTPLNLAWAAGTLGLLLAALRQPSRPALLDLLLHGFLLAYLAAYWLLAFNVWDRYLLPVLPLFALSLARAWLWLTQFTLRSLEAILVRLQGVSPVAGPLAAARRLAPAMLAVTLLPGSGTAVSSAYPIGGDHGAYDGVDTAAYFIHGLPEGSVLYDHWLSWQWNFYLFEAPVYVAWFPSPAALAADLHAFGRASPRYLAIPSWEAETELRLAAAQAGFRLVPLHVSFRRDGTPAITIYQLEPAP